MMMYQRLRGKLISLNFRRFYRSNPRRTVDEGDWLYSPEWYGKQDDGYKSYTVLRGTSVKGNGVVSVHTYPSPRPSVNHWPRTEKWLQQRYAEIHPGCEDNGRFKLLGYQWRTLCFNDNTCQSAVKIMVAYRESDPRPYLYFMQQAHCLAVPYVKSMVSAGLAAVVTSNFDLKNAVLGEKTMNILCIGHRGGSLPLFLASKIQGAIVHIVEIDPLVISLSLKEMGFPYFSVMTPFGERSCAKPDSRDEVLWKGIHERLFLHVSEAEEFLFNTSNLYDMVFVDASDGENVLPQNLWDPHSPFLKALGNRLHPGHGTVVVNLHSDGSVPSVSKAYKDVLVGKGPGLAFNVSVPWVSNTSLVVCRGFGNGSEILDKDLVLNTVISKSQEVQNVLSLPFSCLDYIKRGFTLIE